MASSLIGRLLALEHESNEYLPHLLVGRLRAVLSHGQRVRRLGQLIDLIVVRQFKSDFHLVDGGCAIVGQAPLIVPQQARVDAQDVFVAGIDKGFVRQIHGVLKKALAFGLVHRQIVRDSQRVGHSYFPRGLDIEQRLHFYPASLITSDIRR